jgi:hypothetical protein
MGQQRTCKQFAGTRRVENVQRAAAQLRQILTAIADRRLKLSYRVNEVCAVTSLSKSKVFEFIRTGRLPSRLISGCRIITRRDLERFLQGEAAE